MVIGGDGQIWSLFIMFGICFVFLRVYASENEPQNTIDDEATYASISHCCRKVDRLKVSIFAHDTTNTSLNEEYPAIWPLEPADENSRRPNDSSAPHSQSCQFPKLSNFLDRDLASTASIC